ncbi:type IV pilus modification PilV family protein [Alkalibacillus salilacus]|uniref:Prepilin-type N-terminal cleavage/methylation domain-containing protein n=1 Tax=Alkalibacillus salilacus TaxID=284582 RepID=A0ABT9VFT8_9BACI|nr:prepilin-type N-terminal cleavage/methylation domain-containing protein [Alkalibacillus salilacus]MDQ0159811.1 prepilin-type N-terminal cleavage/methylation domain-containing protein [Alkalibacillus salilacus]
MKRFKKIIQNHKGFSLIEVLAAIVILTIVLTSFIGFFSQSIILSTQTEDELTAVTVAENVLTEIKEDQSQIDALNRSEFTVNNRDYFPIITIIDENEHAELENELDLQQVKIEVVESLENQEQPRATIFGYIQEGDGS